MDIWNDLDLKLLLLQFDQGDQSSEPIVELNRGAITYSHAPWESRLSPGMTKLRRRLGMTEGLLPVDPEDDEDNECSTETEDLDARPHVKPQSSGPELRIPISISESDLPSAPLA